MVTAENIKMQLEKLSGVIVKIEEAGSVKECIDNNLKLHDCTKVVEKFDNRARRKKQIIIILIALALICYFLTMA